LTVASQVSADGRDELYIDSDTLISAATVSTRGATAVMGATSSGWIPGGKVHLLVQTSGNSAFRVKIYATGRRNDTNVAEPGKSCNGNGSCGGKCGAGSTEPGPGGNGRSPARIAGGPPPAMTAPGSPGLTPSSGGILLDSAHRRAPPGGRPGFLSVAGGMP